MKTLSLTAAVAAAIIEAAAIMPVHGEPSPARRSFEEFAKQGAYSEAQRELGKAALAYCEAQATEINNYAGGPGQNLAASACFAGFVEGAKWDATRRGSSARKPHG
jgi:hypothetical protein